MKIRIYDEIKGTFYDANTICECKDSVAKGLWKIHENIPAQFHYCGAIKTERIDY